MLARSLWKGVVVAAVAARLGAMLLVGGALQVLNELERRGRRGRVPERPVARPAPPVSIGPRVASRASPRARPSASWEIGAHVAHKRVAARAGRATRPPVPTPIHRVDQPFSQRPARR